MSWLLIFLLLCPLSSEAQKPPPRKKPAAGSAAKPAPVPMVWTLLDVTVTGNKRYSKNQILAASGLKVGDKVDKKDFDAARDRLVASGSFQSVGYQYSPKPQASGYSLQIEVLEVEQAFAVRFEDLDVSTDDLKKWLTEADPFFGEQISGTKETLERVGRETESYLAAQKIDQKVVGRVVADNPNEVVALFRPDKPRPSVAEVHFTGNKVIPTYALQNRAASVAVGTVYTERRFRQILEANIRTMYEARGRLKVSFPSVKVEPAKEVKGLIVTVEVLEGDSFDLGDVKIVAPGFSTDDLLKAANLKKGDLANFDEVKDALERVRRKVRREGYMQAATHLERKIHDDKKTVDLVITVDKGPQYFFGELTIKGLDLIGEAGILKVWTLEPGKPFNADYPDYFLQQVRDRGLFDDLGTTKAEVTPHEDTHTVDVKLIFKGAPFERKPNPYQPGAPPPPG